MNPIILSAIPISIALLALIVATKNYLRKAGMFVRGSFGMASSSSCNDDYITNVVLENLKDRAVTIFSIFLKVGHNYYIELENLEESPLILRAFETYKKEYGPIEFYGVNHHKINMNPLLKDFKIKKRLVLSTSDGKYTVPSSIRYWNPIGDFFKNHMTAIVRPVKTIYKEKHLGSNIKYVIEFTNDKDQEEIIPIRSRDYELKIFSNFALTKDSLASKEALEELLASKVSEGIVTCKKFKVIELSSWREKQHSFFNGELIESEEYGFFRYHIIGRLLTKYSNWELMRKNRKNNPH